MATFRVQPVSTPDGGFAPVWFDDASYLWDDERLNVPAPLELLWSRPSLRLHRPERGSTSVLFNPNALAVSEHLREALSEFDGLEFLPVEIEGHGTFYVLHVTAAVDLPVGAKVRLAPAPSGNIVDLETFPVEFESLDPFFRIKQPRSSAAGRANYAVRGILANQAGAAALARLAGGLLEARPIRGA